MNELLELGKHGLASQPFSCLLGIELIDLAPGKAEFRLPLKDTLMQQHGFAHGGVVGTLADNGLAFVAGSVLGINVVTSEYKINFVSPAVGDSLIARAKVVSSGKRQAVCSCSVYALKEGEELLVAIAQGTIAKL